MKWFPVFCGLWIVVFLAPLAAQEDGALDWDIDSIFDDSAPDDSAKKTDASGSAGEITVSNLVRQRGFNFDASYEFHGGIAPGWSEAPWVSNAKKEFSLSPGLKMRASLGLDIQISEVFRVKNSVRFEIPDFRFALGDFFFDYSFSDTVFVRGGKYGVSWGISPNYGFTNLLARVPPGSSGGESFIVKAEMPIGVGGIQVLALTRADLMGGVLPGRQNIGLGGKYNLALRWADIDAGAFYQYGMPLRGFLSIKTTVGNTELYHEWMAAIDLQQPENMSGAANIGFSRDFFDNKLTLNGELFFNAEENAYWYHSETILKDAGTSPFISGLSGALNLIYRLGGKGNPRLFTQLLCAPLEYSAQFVPGFGLSPWSHIEFYFAVPMSLGRRESYYYVHTVDSGDRPFSIIMMLSLNGSFQYGRYF